jgi:hypothetical protein
VLAAGPPPIPALVVEKDRDLRYQFAAALRADFRRLRREESGPFRKSGVERGLAVAPRSMWRSRRPLPMPAVMSARERCAAKSPAVTPAGRFRADMTIPRHGRRTERRRWAHW